MSIPVLYIYIYIVCTFIPLLYFATKHQTAYNTNTNLMGEYRAIESTTSFTTNRYDHADSIGSTCPETNKCNSKWYLFKTI